MEPCAEQRMTAKEFLNKREVDIMISMMLSVLGIFLGIILVVLIIAAGFAGGAYKLLKAIIRGVKGLFVDQK